MRGRRPKLNRRQVEYAKFFMRMHHKYVLKRLTTQLGFTDPKAIRGYITGDKLPLEDWLAARGAKA